MIAGQEDYLARNFFVLHQNTIGSSKWLSKCVVCVWLVLNIVIFSLRFIFGVLRDTIDIARVLLCIIASYCIILAIIGKKIPSIYDNFHIKQELKLTMYWIIFLVICGAILQIFIILIGSEVAFFGRSLQLLFYIGSCYFSICYVIKQNINTNGNIHTKNTVAKRAVSASVDESRSNSKHPTPKAENSNVKLDDLLGNAECYQLLMKFLVRYVVYAIYNHIYDLFIY